MDFFLIVTRIGGDIYLSISDRLIELNDLSSSLDSFLAKMLGN